MKCQDVNVQFIGLKKMEDSDGVEGTGWPYRDGDIGSVNAVCPTVPKSMPVVGGAINTINSLDEQRISKSSLLTIFALESDRP